MGWTMKAVIAGFFALAFTSTAAHATNYTGGTSYFGPVQAVASGFWGEVGIGLANGDTCLGRSQVILQRSNSRFNEMLSLMITAAASGKSVKLYNIGTTTVVFAGLTYCVATEASLGDFPGW